MARDPILAWCFSVVVVRLGRRFLLVHERKHGARWYLPAGRLEKGESFAEAARRETFEEAGIHVQLDGVLRVEHSPSPDGSARLRVLFLAHPADDAEPKSVPDEDTLGAGWFTLDEIAKLPLRGDEVIHLLREVDEGAPVHPLGLLQVEGASLFAPPPRLN
jgi:8-oxo-dGTP pyrophosphatase MutT (NUDIX family)